MVGAILINIIISYGLCTYDTRGLYVGYFWESQSLSQALDDLDKCWDLTFH